jgi:hypothetical protein
MRSKLLLSALVMTLAVPVFAQRTDTGTGGPTIDRTNPNSGDSTGTMNTETRRGDSKSTKKQSTQEKRATSGGADTEDRGNPSVDRVNPRSGDSAGAAVPAGSSRK